MPGKTEPQRIDTRGLKCPWPVLRAARAMRDQEAVLLLADDPVALIDVPALAAVHGWRVDLRELPGHAEFLLTKPDQDLAEHARRTASSTPEVHEVHDTGA
jgi:tRNA 2-thiouridine synthesizing protein A